jgi:molecular chaperone GrpE (heat shock protein)
MELLELSDADFAAQMRGLVDEAERALTERGLPPPAPAEPPAEVAPGVPSAASAPESVPAPEAAPKAPLPSVPEMLRPMVQGVQAIGRATGEHTQILGRLEKAAGDAADAHRELPQVITDLKTIIDQRNNVSRQMFDALHEELKTYKDGFLLDTVHRPMIRDLITLYDDLTQIHIQMEEAVAKCRLPGPAGETPEALVGFQRLQNIEVHIQHNLDYILEVLARLEVQQLPVGAGKLDKHTQRAVAVEMAENPEQDMHVARSVKRGFAWKERVFRAEEVVVKKWKEGFLVAMPEA